MASIIFDRREINNRMLLIEYHFVSYDGGQSNCLSLDKFLGADTWSQIYEKLKPSFEAYRTNSSDSLKDSKLSLRRAQLELKVTWKRVSPYHKEIIRYLKGSGCDSPCTDVLFVEVRMVTSIDGYKKQYASEKKTEKRSTESVESEANTHSGSVSVKENRSTNGLTNSQNDEEYVPEFLTEVASSLNYTPSTLSNSIENVTVSAAIADEHIEYEPSLLQNGNNNDSEIVTYTPTKISPTAPKAKKLKSDVNDKKGQPYDRMKEIFGGDSGDDNGSDGKSSRSGSRRLRSAPKPAQIDSEKSKTQSKLDAKYGFTTNQSNRSKRSDTKKDCDRHDDKSKIRKIAMPEMTTECAKKIESEKLRKLTEEYALMDFKISIDEHYDLKAMGVDGILQTYAEHADALRAFYRASKRIPDCRYDPALTENEYTLVLHELLTEKQQQEMYLKLQQIYNPATIKDITSNHENLFWKGMVPEWALLVFMDKFTFTSRTDVLKQLAGQDQARTSRQNPLDLDF